MRTKPVDCAEIRSSFVDGRVPSGAAVDAHVAGCPACRELLHSGPTLGRELAAAALPGFDASGVLRALEQDLERERGVRASLRALPSAARISLWCGSALVLVGYELGFHRRPDFSAYAPSVFWTIVVALLAGLVWGASRVLRGVTLPVRAAQGQGRAAVVLLALPVVVALCSPWGSERAATFGEPARCFTYGTVLVLPFVALYWLLERRDRVSAATLLTVGGAAGVAANLLLYAHCPSVHEGHLLLGHASIGAAWALLLSLPVVVQRAR
jgi:hypothetical protein